MEISLLFIGEIKFFFTKKRSVYENGFTVSIRILVFLKKYPGFLDQYPGFPWSVSCSSLINILVFSWSASLISLISISVFSDQYPSILWSISWVGFLLVSFPRFILNNNLVCMVCMVSILVVVWRILEASNPNMKRRSLNGSISIYLG